MKKIKLIAILLLISMLLFTVGLATAQGFTQPDKAQHDIVYFKLNNNVKPQIKVVYGRPVTNSEEIFGNEVPYGEIWNTGSNEATEIRFYQDIMFGNKYVKAGTYTLYTIPGENYWTVILNAKTDTYGAYFYNPKMDIARIKVPATNGDPLNAFSIGFKTKAYGSQMVLAWGETRVKVPLYMEERLLTKL